MIKKFMYRIPYDIPYVHEEWLRISDSILEIQDDYWINNKGIIYSSRFKIYNTYSLSNTGYYQVSLSSKVDENGVYKRKTYLVHRLVMMCFDPIPNPEKFQVNHMLGIKTLNHIGLLEWCNNKENVVHAFETGLAPVCEDRYNSSLTNEQVEQLCYYIQYSVPYKDIARVVLNIQDAGKNVTSIIQQIKLGFNYRPISSKFNIDYNKPNTQLFTEEQTMIVYNCCKKNMGNFDIIRTLNYCPEDFPLVVLNKFEQSINSIRNGYGYERIIKENLNKQNVI